MVCGISYPAENIKDLRCDSSAAAAPRKNQSNEIENKEREGQVESKKNTEVKQNSSEETHESGSMEKKENDGYKDRRGKLNLGDSGTKTSSDPGHQEEKAGKTS